MTQLYDLGLRLVVFDQRINDDRGRDAEMKTKNNKPRLTVTNGSKAK